MIYSQNKDDFISTIQKKGSGVLYKKISADIITPVLASLKIEKHFPDYHFLLESAENGNNKGRFSVLGFMPDLVWKCHKETSFINSEYKNNPEKFIEQEGNPLENLRKIIKDCQIDWGSLEYGSNTLPNICSGIFGYMGYDMVRLMEKIPDNNLPDDIKIPDSIFIRPQILVVFDNLFDCALICAPVFSLQTYEEITSRILLVEKILAQPLLTSPSKKPKTKKISADFISNCSKEEYCETVTRVKNYINNGDIFQALPSQRFTAEFDKNYSAFSFYRVLRSINPSPFLFYLKFDDFALTGSSPEIMVSLKNEKVTIRPLAGTRARGINLQEDQKIAEELLKNEKEIAEHLMLIDLGRHDVGSVCRHSSVKVTKKMVIENYSHVMHISSNVEGILREGLDALDALIAGFPAGTVSGAPKIRAMEIIEEVEKVKRGFYAGCVGYFSSNGDMETCITLRSALIKNDKIYLHSGAGVVFDSNPDSESQECLNKAQALIKAYKEMLSFCH